MRKCTSDHDAKEMAMIANDGLEWPMTDNDALWWSVVGNEATLSWLIMVKNGSEPHAKDG